MRLLVDAGAVVGARAVSGCALALVSAVLLTTDISTSATRPLAQYSECTRTITRPDDVSPALTAAAPGDMLCFVGDNLAQTDIVMTSSGTAEAPIRLVAAGATVRQIRIAANHIVLHGFTVAGGAEVLLQGTRIIARNNTVRDTWRGGIVCYPCTDSTIESNTVQHATTIGIYLLGQSITANANTVRGTVPYNNGDADGIRFFGNGHRITNNTIRDISAEGYVDPSHPDCFQTFDNSRPPTFDIVLSGNNCHNVDAQCLIATGDERGNSGAPASSASIIFRGNTCAVNGAQAVNLRRWARVEVRDNRFSGPNLLRAILIVNNSTSCSVINNAVAGEVPLVEIDESSRPGFHQEGNRSTPSSHN